MNITAIAILAIAIEAVITWVKEISSGTIKWQMIAAAIIGILICIAYSADILAGNGLVSTIPYVGCIITGIAASRGSNYFFDLIKSFNK